MVAATKKRLVKFQSLFLSRITLHPILAHLEHPTTEVAGFSGHHNLPIRFIEEVSERVEVAKNYRAIPVVPTVRLIEKFVDMPRN